MTKYWQTELPDASNEAPKDPLALKLWQLDQKMDRAEREQAQLEERKRQEEEFAKSNKIDEKKYQYYLGFLTVAKSFI